MLQVLYTMSNLSISLLHSPVPMSPSGMDVRDVDGATSPGRPLKFSETPRRVRLACNPCRIRKSRVRVSSYRLDWALWLTPWAASVSAMEERPAAPCVSRLAASVSI
jgi:hypothetical protein